MKALKRILLVAAAVLLVGLGALFLFLDPIVAKAIETGSNYATGVETHGGGVDASLLSGHFGLDHLSLANPPGFAAEPFLKLGSARATWQNGSILSDTIEMDELLVQGAE